MKTKKIVSKRFKLTKSGKLMFRAQGARHIRRNKSKSRQRRQDKMHELTNARLTRMVRQFISA